MKKLCMFMALILLICQFSSITAEAGEYDTDEQIREKILSISDMISDKVSMELDGLQNDIKNRCIINKYDYYASVEDLRNQGNPYRETDYLAIIAAYLTAKTFSEKIINDLYQIDFVHASYAVCSMEGYHVTQIPAYVETYAGSKRFVQLGMDIISYPTMIDVFEQQKDGHYAKVGSTEYTPDTEEIKYIKSEVTGLSKDDIYQCYSFNETREAKKYYNSIYKKMSNIVNGNGLNSSYFLNIMNDSMITDEQRELIRSLVEESDIPPQIKTVLTVACSLIGKVPYEWGGKAAHPGYDPSWWSIDDSTNIQKGLDCSGFVQWVFMTAGYSHDVTDHMISTTSILHSFDTITKNELSPGDIGLLNTGEGMTNHTGIYLGDGYWIHCSSGKKTVAIEQTDMFTIYKNFPTAAADANIEDAVLNGDYQLAGYNYSGIYTDNDVYLLAQLIYNEAAGEGMNGWIGVAEVVKNRLSSDMFPDELGDIIYSGQFADADKISGRIPTESMVFVARQVLEGNLGIFNNPQVLFFRNAGGLQSDWGTYPYYMTINHHQFYTYPDKEQ